MARRSKPNPRQDRGPIAQAFDAFTVAIFIIVAIVTLLAVSYVLANGDRQDAPAFGPMASMTPAFGL